MFSPSWLAILAHLQPAALGARVQDVPGVVHSQVHEGGGRAKEEGGHKGRQQLAQAARVADLLAGRVGMS